MTSDLLAKFTNNYRQALLGGAKLARELGQPEILPAHVFFGLLERRGSVGAEIFAGLKLNPAELKKFLAEQVFAPSTRRPAEGATPDFSRRSRSLIQKSIKLAYLNGHCYVGSEHLLAALIELNDPQVNQIISAIKIPHQRLVQQTRLTLGSVSKLPELIGAAPAAKKKPVSPFIEEAADFDGDNEAPDILDYFGANLTSAKFQKKVDPVIGREEEIERVIQILSRRTKNNPIILGDAGVGKTAIVEGLAKKILLGQVPEILAGKKIYALDLASLVAGTMYRGDFENRVKQIIEEVSSRPEVILFIDEIHNLVGAGSASGSLDAANMLKPALARGQIRCIGATTFSDYRKSIENDPALERRFQPVKISEPTAEQAKKILLGVKQYFENYHQVAISNAAAAAAVDLSQKYLTDKFLPDKAIDLIDEAAAAIKAKQGFTPLQRDLKKIGEEVGALEAGLRELIKNENYTLAINLRQQIREVMNNLEQLKIRERAEKNKLIGCVEAADIARIISRITGVPLGDLLASEKQRLADLAGELKRQIIGQDQAIDEIIGYVKRAKAGLNPENKPLASFLFVGPSGTGKTYTAKKLAQALFGDEKSFIRIDMSEYGEKFNASKLIGAPAGYVGYKESGLLTEKVKHKPYCLVLFDEMEKANPEIFDLLLQVLDDGCLTDAAGAKINFQNTIIIMTSNIGSAHFQPGELIGFGSAKAAANADGAREKALAETKKFFKPEFLNRLDQVICFNYLAEKDLVKIAQLELIKLAKRLERKGIKLLSNLGAAKIIAAQAQQEQGARGIKHAILELVEAPLAQKILGEEISAGGTIRLEAKNGIIRLD